VEMMNQFKLFNPGENLKKIEIKSKPKLKYSTIVINFPGRIHITPIDCNRFEFGKPGGGGMGFAINLNNILKINLTEETKIKLNCKKFTPVILHYFKLLKEIFEFEECFNIDLCVSNLLRQHFGLGSSISVGTSIIYGLNYIFNSPLTLNDIRQLVGNNFVEEYNDMLSRGLETGVGSAVVLKGGFSLIANDLIEIFHTNVFRGKTVIIIDPKVGRKGIDKPESMEMLNRSVFLDKSYSYIKSYDLLMDIIPAIYQNNLKKFGDYVWNIQFSGTHLSMIQSYENFGCKIYDILSLLKSQRILICGLSSVGPTIFALDEKSKINKTLLKLSETFNKNIDVHILKVNSSGIRIINKTIYKGDRRPSK
jgi:beta-RFAP synthase